ncbi:MAG: hypothetical protein FJ388_20015, partial [Verrucomicrobia bacterium]|nr:hypothetical protein [Verrucomicrobiota bacterium]
MIERAHEERATARGVKMHSSNHFLSVRTAKADASRLPPRRAGSLITHHSSLSAFTLIETMAVIIIILLLVGVSMPTFVRAHRSEMLRSEASMLRSTVLHARYQAIVHQQPMLLNLDFDNQAYWIEMSQVT